jgi:hypothetical protein
MLLEILSAIRTAKDVGTLFSALGYTEEDLPFTGGTMTVARWKGFKVIAADREHARDGVREFAREVAKTSERALTAVVSPERELALAAPRFGQIGITKVLVVSLDNPCSFAVEQLKRLGPNGRSTALAHALSVRDVLSSEEMGERFFTEFRIHLERMAAAIDRSRSAQDRRMVALLCLSRILFLYFVQAKGYLIRCSLER